MNLGYKPWEDWLMAVNLMGDCLTIHSAPSSREMWSYLPPSAEEGLFVAHLYVKPVALWASSIM